MINRIWSVDMVNRTASRALVRDLCVAAWNGDGMMIVGIGGIRCFCGLLQSGVLLDMAPVCIYGKFEDKGSSVQVWEKCAGS
jgi:hypothetical protein